MQFIHKVKSYVASCSGRPQAMGNVLSTQKFLSDLWQVNTFPKRRRKMAPAELELARYPSCEDCSYCDKKLFFDEGAVYVDIFTGKFVIDGVIKNDYSGPPKPKKHNWLVTRRRSEDFDERSWRQTYPQTMVFAVELYYNMQFIKKQDLRELKVLQKQENKAYQDLVLKAQYIRQQEERRYELEMQALLRSFEAEIEGSNKQQKQQVEKAEVTQGLDMKVASKKIKQDQERELRMFHETLKQELKLLKQECELLPKDQRKDTLRRRREEKEIEHQERERQFLEQQQESFDKSMKRLSDQHREKIALLEKQFLQQKQQMLRAREAAIWEMEERHLHEKHQLAKRQLKDMFFLKRHQMLTRHDKELAQIKRINARKEEELLRRQAIEKKRMPKIQKGEMKTRAQIFKQSLRISMVINPEEERDKIRQFEENEKKRVKAEQLRQELKHKKQWDELTNKNMTQLRELEQLQAEKRKMLMEQETQKIQELDEHYQNELLEWKSKLQPRKQQLEEEFARQREKQEKFYGGTISNGGAAGNLTPNEIQRLNANSGSRTSTVL